jgi:hypothetical protein
MTTPPRAAGPPSRADSVQGHPGNMVGPVAYDDDRDEATRGRWGPPPPDEWRNYWARKRYEREWYPEYAGPERDYYESAPRASGMYRSGSRRGPAVVYRLPRNSYHGAERRGSFDGPPRAPPKPTVEDYYDSEDDMGGYTGQRHYGGAGGRGPPADGGTITSQSMRSVRDNTLLRRRC